MTPQERPHWRLWDVADLLADLDSREYFDVIEGIIPSQAITLFTGGPKAGKTTMLFSMLESMRTGLPWCGRKVLPGAAWVFTDEGGRSLKELLHRVGPWLPTDHRISLFSDVAGIPWDIVAQSIVNEYKSIAETLDPNHFIPQAIDHPAYPKTGRPPLPPRVIVVDTLGQWSRMGDINKYTDAIQAFEWLKWLRDATGCAIVVVHHTKKDDADSINSSLGSQAIAGQADHIIRIGKEADDPNKRILEMAGRFDMMGDMVVAFDPDSGHYSASEGRKHQDPKEEDAVVMAFFTGPDVEYSTGKMAEALKVSPESARRRLKRLQAAGRLETNDRTGAFHAYRLPRFRTEFGEQNPGLAEVPSRSD